MDRSADTRTDREKNIWKKNFTIETFSGGKNLNSKQKKNRKFTEILTNRNLVFFCAENKSRNFEQN